MKNLLIISRPQFGYLVDLYKWCKYIDSDYNIDVVTFGSRPKVSLDRNNLRVHYVSDKGNRLVRGLRFIIISVWYILKNKGSIIIEYFIGCNVFKILVPYKKMVLDIRTLSVSDKREIREKDDRILKGYTEIFDYISIVSDSARIKLGLDYSKTFVVPLGADIISVTNKNYDNLNLLYVGTLTNRRIDKTIYGLKFFIERNPNVSIHYDIVGDGHGAELKELSNLIDMLGVGNFVTLHGYKRHHEIKYLYDSNNIGVSFVPITDYYNSQPPTKTYEYILSGLYTIATGTDCNKEIVTSDSGIIINDSDSDFCSALEYIHLNKTELDSNKVRETLIDYQWEKIVNRYLHAMLDTIDKNS